MLEKYDVDFKYTICTKAVALLGQDIVAYRAGLLFDKDFNVKLYDYLVENNNDDNNYITKLKRKKLNRKNFNVYELDISLCFAILRFDKTISSAGVTPHESKKENNWFWTFSLFRDKGSHQSYTEKNEKSKEDMLAIGIDLLGKALNHYSFLRESTRETIIDACGISGKYINAVKYLNNGDVAQAEQLLSQLTDEDYPPVFATLSKIYRTAMLPDKNEDFPLALRMMQRAHELNPEKYSHDLTRMQQIERLLDEVQQGDVTALYAVAKIRWQGEYLENNADTISQLLQNAKNKDAAALNGLIKDDLFNREEFAVHVAMLLNDMSMLHEVSADYNISLHTFGELEPFQKAVLRAVMRDNETILAYFNMVEKFAKNHFGKSAENPLSEQEISNLNECFTQAQFVLQNPIDYPGYPVFEDTAKYICAEYFYFCENDIRRTFEFYESCFDEFSYLYGDNTPLKRIVMILNQDYSYLNKKFIAIINNNEEVLVSSYFDKELLERYGAYDQYVDLIKQRASEILEKFNAMWENYNRNSMVVNLLIGATQSRSWLTLQNITTNASKMLTFANATLKIQPIEQFYEIVNLINVIGGYSQNMLQLEESLGNLHTTPEGVSRIIKGKKAFFKLMKSAPDSYEIFKHVAKFNHPDLTDEVLIWLHKNYKNYEFDFAAEYDNHHKKLNRILAKKARYKEKAVFYLKALAVAGAIGAGVFAVVVGVVIYGYIDMNSKLDTADELYQQGMYTEAFDAYYEIAYIEGGKPLCDNIEQEAQAGRLEIVNMLRDEAALQYGADIKKEVDGLSVGDELKLIIGEGYEMYTPINDYVGNIVDAVPFGVYDILFVLTDDNKLYGFAQNAWESGYSPIEGENLEVKQFEGDFARIEVYNGVAYLQKTDESWVIEAGPAASIYANLDTTNLKQPLSENIWEMTDGSFIYINTEGALLDLLPYTLPVDAAAVYTHADYVITTLFDDGTVYSREVLMADEEKLAYSQTAAQSINATMQTLAGEHFIRLYHGHEASFFALSQSGALYYIDYTKSEPIIIAQQGVKPEHITVFLNDWSDAWHNTIMLTRQDGSMISLSGYIDYIDDEATTDPLPIEEVVSYHNDGILFTDGSTYPKLYDTTDGNSYMLNNFVYTQNGELITVQDMVE